MYSTVHRRQVGASPPPLSSIWFSYRLNTELTILYSIPVECTLSQWHPIKMFTHRLCKFTYVDTLYSTLSMYFDLLCSTVYSKTCISRTLMVHVKSVRDRQIFDLSRFKKPSLVSWCSLLMVRHTQVFDLVGFIFTRNGKRAEISTNNNMHIFEMFKWNMLYSLYKVRMIRIILFPPDLV